MSASRECADERRRVDRPTVPAQRLASTKPGSASRACGSGSRWLGAVGDDDNRAAPATLATATASRSRSASRAARPPPAVAASGVRPGEQAAGPDFDAARWENRLASSESAASSRSAAVMISCAALLVGRVHGWNRQARRASCGPICAVVRVSRLRIDGCASRRSKTRLPREASCAAELRCCVRPLEVDPNASIHEPGASRGRASELKKSPTACWAKAPAKPGRSCGAAYEARCCHSSRSGRWGEQEAPRDVVARRRASRGVIRRADARRWPP
jgi:hypothetical protein